MDREIGRGSAATVFLARDVLHDRPVAIKVLRQELPAFVGADRFLREIRLAAQLTHPHILSIYDSGEAGSLLYYVMPFVDGVAMFTAMPGGNLRLCLPCRTGHISEPGPF